MNTSDDMRRLIDQINSTGNKPEIIVEDDQSPMARFAKWSLSEATSEDVLEPKKDIIDDDEEVVEEDNHLDRMFAHHMAGHEDYFDQYNMFKGVNEDDEEERYRDFDMDGESADMRDIDPDEDFNPEYLGPTTPADFEGDAPLDAEDERRWLYKISGPARIRSGTLG